MTTTIHHELLQEILKHPDDDELRLIFADWLEEQGLVAYPEFIRVQVRLPLIAQCSKPDCFGDVNGVDPELCLWWICAHCQERLRLRKKNSELLEHPEVKKMLRVPGISGFGCIIDRGFVGEITCAANDWMLGGEMAVMAQPIGVVRIRKQVDRENYQWVMNDMEEHAALNEQQLRDIFEKRHPRIQFFFGHYAEANSW